VSYIKILGAQGSRTNDAFTTCFQLTKHTLIDAGNIMAALGENALHVNRIFFSHSHLDHIIDSAFLMDNSFAQRSEPLYLYGLPETLDALKKHIFNGDIWPDFSEINLIGQEQASVVYVEIEAGKCYFIEEGITLTPILANHTVACCGYLIEQNNSGIVYTGDTYKNPLLWNFINERPFIKGMIIDVSFPNHLSKIAYASKHLTPKLLAEEIASLTHKTLHVYINHLKPFYVDQIREELSQIGIKSTHILEDGEYISLETGDIRRVTTRSAIKDKIQKLNNIGIALSAEENLDALLEMIVTEAKNLTHADGGTLYLMEKNSLRFKVVQTDSLGIKMGGTSGKITWPPLPLYLEEGKPNKKMVAATCVLENRIINIPDVYEAEGFSFEGTKEFDKNTKYRSKSMLVIPLKNHENEIIGALQLINKTDTQTLQAIPFDDADASITLSLASQAAVSITNKMLLQGLENLLEAFLNSIIFAIGKKSPYTEGHIRRMVSLTLMLSEAIHEDEGVFKEKRFKTEDFKQINFAALMHDIGKLATPEYVVDKAAKLETLFDRVALVESRIEVIKKALHVSFLKQKILLLERNALEEIDYQEKAFHEKVTLLDDYGAFIKKHNTGSEFMEDVHVQTIQKIAQEPWIIEGETYPILTENEAYNLSVQRGTITNEERSIINEHAKISVDILNNLPFPKKYKEVPQISGNHHEKINGKGYPQGLKGDEISFEARILAITDVFEALTASDRPYKKANPLSIAMKILYFMAKEGDLDKEIVTFFYTSGLYMEYAKEHLPQSSIDEVTVDFTTL